MYTLKKKCSQNDKAPGCLNDKVLTVEAAFNVGKNNLWKCSLQLLCCKQGLRLWWLLFQEHLQEHRDPFVGGTRYKFEILRFMVIADKGQFFMGQGEQMSMEAGAVFITIILMFFLLEQIWRNALFQINIRLALWI